MKKIKTILLRFKSYFGNKQISEKPQLIAITQENFCHIMAITDYYYNESNLFI